MKLYYTQLHNGIVTIIHCIDGTCWDEEFIPGTQEENQTHAIQEHLIMLQKAEDSARLHLQNFPKDETYSKTELKRRHPDATEYEHNGGVYLLLAEEDKQEIPTYTFPGKKQLEKLPQIRVDGDPNRYAMWIHDHTEIDRRVPPIFLDFVIHLEYIMVAVHYTPDMTAFHTKIWYEKQQSAIAIGYTNYNSINGTSVGAVARFSEAMQDKYGAEWIRSIVLAAAFTVIGVQAYMLYHKPEIVEQIYTPGEERKPSAKKRITQQPIKIRKTKIKRIYLSDQDKPKKEIHYNKLSWHVRGHYKHVGKDKHLVYIQPSIRNRNGKKYSVKGQTYEIEGDKT